MDGVASTPGGSAEKEKIELPDIGSITLESTAHVDDGDLSKDPKGLAGNGSGAGTVSGTTSSTRKASSTAKNAAVIAVAKTIDHPNYKEKVQLQNGPPPARVKALLDSSGYSVEVTPYMRKFGGPPPDGSTRPIGTELYVGKLDKNCFEDELYPLFEPFGKIWEVRIIIDSETQNGRGFGFVTYVAPESCSKAVAALNEKTVQTVTGRKLTLTVRHNQHRIFVGSIPKEKNRQELLATFKPELEGLVDVIVHSAGEESGATFRNRGFCFLEFDTFDHANYALQRIQMRKTSPFKHRIFGNWAQTQLEPDEETMKSSKVLFLDNLSNEQNEKVLTDALKPYAGFVHVKKSYAYAFARFDTRENAQKALTDILNGQVQACCGAAALNATWARPDRNNNTGKSATTRFSNNNGYGRGYYGGGYGNDYYYYEKDYYNASSRANWNRGNGNDAAGRRNYGGDAHNHVGGPRGSRSRNGGVTTSQRGDRGCYNDYGGDTSGYYYHDDHTYLHRYHAEYDKSSRQQQQQQRWGNDNRQRANAFYAAAASHHYIPPPLVGHHFPAVYAPTAGAYGYTYAAHHPPPPPPPHYGPPLPAHFHRYITSSAAAAAAVATQASWSAYRRGYPHAAAAAASFSTSRGGLRGRAADGKAFRGETSGRSGGGAKRGASTAAVGRGAGLSAAGGAAANGTGGGSSASNGGRRSPLRSGVPMTTAAAPAVSTDSNYETAASMAPYGNADSSSAYAQQRPYESSGGYPPQQDIALDSAAILFKTAVWFILFFAQLITREQTEYTIRCASIGLP